MRWTVCFVDVFRGGAAGEAEEAPNAALWGETEARGCIVLAGDFAGSLRFGTVSAHGVSGLCGVLEGLGWGIMPAMVGFGMDGMRMWWVFKFLWCSVSIFLPYQMRSFSERGPVECVQMGLSKSHTPSLAHVVMSHPKLGQCSPQKGLAVILTSLNLGLLSRTIHCRYHPLL